MRVSQLLCCALLIWTSAIQAQTTPQLLPDEQNTVDIFQKMAPIVVNVHNLQSVVTPYMDVYQVQRGMGSGFIWNKDGYVVTNVHVIRDASRIAITLQKGKAVSARVIGVDVRKDIAVLKLDSSVQVKDFMPFNEIPTADSSKLLVGQKTLAIGNPFGLERTLTTGVISALDRQIPSQNGVYLHGLIQTDASINPGNSGGPLFDSAGQLIGMNTLIFSNTGTSSGLGFALPVNDIKRIVTQLIKTGKVSQAGIGIERLSDQIASELGVQGVIVGRVASDSPAAKAGLKGASISVEGTIHLGDIIVALNGEPVKNYDDLYTLLDKVGVDQEITLSLLRDNKTVTITLKTVDLSR
jgi:S1-C subfamily serine protease